MTDEARLGPSSCVILGILAAAGPQTPYSLKQAVGRTIGYYWPFPHAQIYAETARLAELGLAVEDREASGLRRRTYAITRPGREALAAWLAAPTPDPAQFRDPGLLKLAFGSLASPEARRTLRDGQVAAHEERLATYEQYATMPLDRYLRATLELGLRYERAALGFWQTLDLEDEAPLVPGLAPTAGEGPAPEPESTSN